MKHCYRHGMPNQKLLFVWLQRGLTDVQKMPVSRLRWPLKSTSIWLMSFNFINGICKTNDQYLPCCRYGGEARNWAEFAFACASDIWLAMFEVGIGCVPPIPIPTPAPVWICVGKLSTFDDGSIGRAYWFMLYNLLSSSGFNAFVWFAVYGINCMFAEIVAADADAVAAAALAVAVATATWCW